MSSVIDFPNTFSKSYSTGDVIQCPDGKVIKSKEGISKIFSLYFTWKSISNLHMFNAALETWEPCEIDYDSELKEIDELYIKSKNQSLKSGCEIVFRIETFGVCYEFKSILVDIATDEVFSLTILPPNVVTVIKKRNKERTLLDNTTVPEGLTIYLRLNDATIEINQITEISTTTIVIPNLKVYNLSIEAKYYLVINETDVSVKYLKDINTGHCFNVVDDRISTIKEFFGLYISLIYKNLSFRSHSDYEKLLDLFFKANYFKDFHNSLGDNFRSDIKSLWSKIDQSSNKYSFDCLTKDYNGTYTGSSSLTKIAEDNDVVFWIYHQLCALKKPALLESTGLLYYWRALILSLFKDDFKVKSFFRSSSRWLERVYVKFEVNSKKGHSVFPVNIYRIHKDQFEEIKRKYPAENNDFHIYRNSERYYFHDENCYGGVLPDYLNLSGILNIMFFKNDQSVETMMKSLSSLVHSLKPNNIDIKFINFVTDYDVKLDFLKGSSDRMILFDKDDQYDFINSLKHSIEITKKKYA